MTRRWRLLLSTLSTVFVALAIISYWPQAALLLQDQPSGALASAQQSSGVEPAPIEDEEEDDD